MIQLARRLADRAYVAAVVVFVVLDGSGGGWVLPAGPRALYILQNI